MLLTTSPLSDDRVEPDGLLGELERIARETGADFLADEARALAERAAEGRFYVACIGHFKRGKSTLINALVGESILPTGVVPITSVPTILRFGDRGARVRLGGGAWRSIDVGSVAEFVSEERNPGNSRGVLAVEVFLPAPILASGLCLADTPGLGSVIEANSEATREFLPHIDAALVTLGADPPISGDELRLVEEIARRTDALLFVLNKADRSTDAEREEAEAFARRVLSERLGRPIGRIYRVSALERLASGRRLWDWDQLTEQLRDLAEHSGRALAAQAARRGIEHLGLRIRRTLDEQLAALRRPVEESERRLEALRSVAAEAKRALDELGPLFAAEEQRLSASFSARRTEFLTRALPRAASALQEAIRSDRRDVASVRRQAYDAALRIARERIEPWLSDSEEAATEAYRVAAKRFAEIANGLLHRLRETDAWLSAVLPADIEAESALHGSRQFRFYEFTHLTSPAGGEAVVEWLADHLLPGRIGRKRIESRATEFLHRVLETNAARVENDLAERVRESRLRLEREIRDALTEGLRASGLAVERARAAQAHGLEAVQDALSHLESLQARLAGLLDAAALSPPV